MPISRETFEKFKNEIDFDRIVAENVYLIANEVPNVPVARIAQVVTSHVDERFWDRYQARG